MPQVNRKRPAPSASARKINKRGSHTILAVQQASSKKRKFSVDSKSKEKVAHRKTIPIPAADQDNEDLSDQDLDIIGTYGDGITFLQNLDHIGIARYELLFPCQGRYSSLLEQE
jgi:hypothetical protein